MSAQRPRALLASGALAVEGRRVVAVLCGNCGGASVVTRVWLRRVMASLVGAPSRGLGPDESPLVCLYCGASIRSEERLLKEAQRLDAAFDALRARPACGPAEPGVPRRRLDG